MSFPWRVPRPASALHQLQCSRSRHEQESSQHMAAVASYLASLSPSPSPLVTSIHMCSPSFLSRSPPPALRSLARPLTLGLPHPSLLSLPPSPFPFSLSVAANRSVFLPVSHTHKKSGHTENASTAVFKRGQEGVKETAEGRYSTDRQDSV